MFDRNRRGYKGQIKLAVLGAVLSLSLMTTEPASADPISGEIAFVGLFTLTGGSGPQDYLGATGLDFGFSSVVLATDDFVSNGVIPFLTPVTMNDFMFMPFSGPVDPLWSVGIFQFALEDLSGLSRGNNYLALSGTGMVSAANPSLEDTLFRWNFVGGSAGGQLQIYASTAVPTPLPEPSQFFTLGFLTVALAGMCIWSRCSPNTARPSP